MNNLVKVDHLSIVFKNFKALNNINITITKKNGVIGLIGPNGAGKTTLINAILGQLKPHEGTVVVDQDKIGYCPDVPAFEPFLTPLEILEQTLRLRGIYRNDYREKMTDVLKEVDLIKYKNKIVSGFSRGMKQRLGIASTLVLEPDIIFLDEPTSALDPFGQKDIIQLIEKISKDRVIVLSSHNLKEIEGSVEDLIVLNKGQLIFWGSISEFTTNKEQFYSIEFDNKRVTIEFYELLKSNGIQATLNNDKIIKFNSTYIKEIIEYIVPYANHLKSLEGDIVSLNDAFEAHIFELSKGGEFNSD